MGFIQRQCLLHQQKYGGWNLGKLRKDCAMQGLEIGGKKGGVGDAVGGLVLHGSSGRPS